ncbi:MAG: cupin domain-containing protein [Deltaproteobacteria bacterium]|nr:cupin domain-containing protein [Deltaproteobacteria bacterium]
MKKKHWTEVEGILSDKEGFKGMNQRFIWTKPDGCENFAMRLMEFEPYGHTSYHAHMEDHEFFILEGEAVAVDAAGNEIKLREGDTLYVPPDEPHQMKNAGGSPMRMLCMIPILPGGDGKTPAPRPDGQDYVTKEKPS